MKKDTPIYTVRLCAAISVFVLACALLASCSSSRQMESCDYLAKKMSGYNFESKKPGGFKY